jgi:hypothetical protein
MIVEQGLIIFWTVLIAVYLAVVASHFSVQWWSGIQYRRKAKRDGAIMKDVLAKQSQYIQEYTDAIDRMQQDRRNSRRDDA